jgi:uncharacterized secreted protein with C-terminal beta-propeller domain
VIIPSLPPNTSKSVENVINSQEPRYEKIRKIDELVGIYLDDLDDGEKERVEGEWEERSNGFELLIQNETEKTIIHRIWIRNGQIRYRASGGVLGYVLNRFSMDEYKGYFRVATTTGQIWRSGGSGSNNHVFTLGLDLNVVGKIVNIAPGERIYSARFMGDRAYLVTFKKVDPFFVLDLEDPTTPEILGELKIPGYSNYLHPYDENHVIGIGKECVDMGDFAWYQGVKLSLFDASDVNNPRELSKYIVGDRGTESLALHDPHTFLFSRQKNLLVIPIWLAEIDEDKYSGDIPPNAYGEHIWHGAYVFDLSLENGFVMRGRITHEDGGDNDHSYGYYHSPFRVKRTFYIDDYLHTVSDVLLEAHYIDSLEEIADVDLP